MAEEVEGDVLEKAESSFTELLSLLSNRDADVVRSYFLNHTCIHM
jgi:hypothetical protein